MPGTHQLWWQRKAAVWRTTIRDFIRAAQRAGHTALNHAVAGSSPTVGVSPAAVAASLPCALCAPATMGVCGERMDCLPDDVLSPA